MVQNGSTCQCKPYTVPLASSSTIIFSELIGICDAIPLCATSSHCIDNCEMLKDSCPCGTLAMNRHIEVVVKAVLCEPCYATRNTLEEPYAYLLIEADDADLGTWRLANATLNNAQPPPPPPPAEFFIYSCLSNEYVPLVAYSYSLSRSTPLVPRFPSFGNLDEMYCSKAAAIPKRNTRAKLNHRTAKVTARAYDYELIAFNIITVYVISTLFPSLLCIRSGRFRSRPASFETRRPASKRAGGCESGHNIYILYTLCVSDPLGDMNTCVYSLHCRNSKFVNISWYLSFLRIQFKGERKRGWVQLH